MDFYEVTFFFLNLLLMIILIKIYFSPMNEQRSGAGVVALGPYIYVVGGMGANGQLNSFERYDTEKDVWSTLAPMSTARSALTLAILENKIYAMGG